MQLDFLEEMTEYKMLSKQNREIIEMYHKLRKSIFAQLNEYDKVLLKLQDQIDFMRQSQRESQIVQIK